MTRAGLLLATLSWAILALIAFGIYAAVSSAAVIEGTGQGDVLTGTAYADKMYGYGGADTIRAGSGKDYAEGGSGPDTLDMGCGYDEGQGNGGEDLIYVDCADGKPDVVDCGSEDDIVFWRVAGTVLIRCENAYHVTRQKDASELGGMAPWPYYTEDAAKWQEAERLLREVYAAYDQQLGYAEGP